MTTEEKLPETVEELCNYIERHASAIYIRERNPEGKWDSIALTELPVERAIHHALRFVREGRVPVRVLRELDNEKDAG